MVAMFTDITGRKRSESELRAAYEQVASAREELRSQYDELAKAQDSLVQQEKLLENTFSSIQDGISILDRTMTIVRINRTMEEWYSHEMPLVGKKCWEAYHGRTERCEVCPSYRTLLTGLPDRELVPLVDAGKTTGCVDLYSYPLIDSVNGEMSGVIEYVRNVTEEKRAQDELREKNEELDRFFTMSLDLLCIADTDGNFLRVNPKWEQTLGYSRAELEGRRFLDFVHPDDLPATLAEVADLKSQKEVTDFTNRYRCKDGSYRWIEWRSRPLGKLIYAAARDITDKKRIADALDLLRRQDREALRVARMGHFEFDVESQTFIFNDEYYEMIGTAAGEMGGYRIPADEFAKRFIPPDNADLVPDTIRKAIETDDPDFQIRFESPFIRPDGTRTWMEVWFRIEKDASGKTTRFYGVNQDITERKKAETALRESEARFRAVIDQSFQFIGLLNTDGTLIEANRSSLTFAGISEAEVINRPFWETPWWSHSRDLQEKLKDAIHRAASGETVRFEATHPAADGHLVSVDFSVKPVVDPQGRIQYLIPEGRDITERKRTEEALFNSQQMLQAVLDSIPQRVFWKDRNSVYLGCNLPLAKDAGYADPKDLVGKDDYDTASKAMADLYRADDHQVMETGQPRINFEEPQIRPDGSQAWLRTTKVPLRDKEGTIIGVLGTYEDITERKRMEEVLRESEEKYRLISENSPNMIYFIDPGGYLRYVNAFAAKAMRAEPEDLAGKHLTTLFGPDTARQHLEAVNRVISSRITIQNEIYEDLPSGGVWLDVRLSPLVDETGRVLGVLGLSHDISDRKQAEEALRESETKYRMLVENSHDIIYTISPDGILTFVSPGWTALLGHDPAYVTGKPFQHFVHPADITACKAFLANAVSTRQRQSGVEYRVFHADGSIRIHTSTISPVFDDNGSIVSYIGSARDITDMKRFQNAIRESNRKLNLLSSITRHDVANQLTVVQGYTQLAALRKTDPITMDFLAKIASAVDMIQHQIEFTRTYQDLGAQEPAWFRLGEVIRSVQPPEITLVYTCDSFELFADPMIAKVFFNLFDNAVKYGKRVTTVTVGCELAGDELVITFADNGIGIPLNEKQKIFEKGFGQHTGFGLFLAREILAITGISIHETGAHGKGARFEIVVPKGAYRSV